MVPQVEAQPNLPPTHWTWDHSGCENFAKCGRTMAIYTDKGVTRCPCLYKKKFSARIGAELFSPDYYHKKSVLNNHLSKNVRLIGDLEEIKRHITATLGPSSALSPLKPLAVLDVCSLVDVYLNQHPDWQSFVYLYNERHMVLKAGFQSIENKKTSELLQGLLVARLQRGHGTWIIQSAPLNQIKTRLGNLVVSILEPIDHVTFTKREVAKAN